MGAWDSLFCTASEMLKRWCLVVALSLRAVEARSTALQEVEDGVEEIYFIGMLQNGGERAALVSEEPAQHGVFDWNGGYTWVIMSHSTRSYFCASLLS
jgi:hypothetical protein